MKNKKDAQEAMLHIMYGMSLILDMAVSELGVPALPEMKAAKKQESDSEVTATANSGAPVVEQNEAGKSNAEAGGVADSATEKEDEETEKFKKTASPLLVKLVVVLREVMQQVEKEAKAKRDLIVPAQSIFMGDEADWIGIYNKNSTERFAPNTLFHHQMASALNIPTKFYDYLAQTHPELLVSTVNTLVYDRKVNYMVRTMDYGSGMPTARAFLSERYRRVDNLEIATATLPLFAGLPDVEVVSTEVTESRLHIKIVNHRLEAEVKKGDIVQAGVVISNSEVGLGAVSVRPLLYRLVCTNGMILNSLGERRHHVGRQQKAIEDCDYTVYSDETMEAEDKAFLLKLRDATTAAIEESRFHTAVDQLKEAAGIPIEGAVTDVVELTAKNYGMNSDEQNSILKYLIEGGDLSKYGLSNAITRASQDIESYDRATVLEEVGWQVATMEPKQWKILNQ